MDESNGVNEKINESGLLSFSCNKSFEQFLDFDSILNSIPETFELEADKFGDTIDWRHNKASGIQANEWGRCYKNPIITSNREENNSVIISIEFTGGGGYKFDGEIQSVADTLELIYSDISSKNEREQKDTRYILDYEIKKEVFLDKIIKIKYQKR